MYYKMGDRIYTGQASNHEGKYATIIGVYEDMWGGYHIWIDVDDDQCGSRSAGAHTYGDKCPGMRKITPEEDPRVTKNRFSRLDTD